MMLQSIFLHLGLVSSAVKSTTIDSSIISNNISELTTEINFSSSRVGTIDALASVLNISQIETVLSHGCWCSGLKSGSNSDLLGNFKYLQPDENCGACGQKDKNPGRPVDLLDNYCKLWIHDRRCLKLKNGVCYNEEIDSYSLKFTRDDLNKFSVDSSFCESNENSCQSMMCLLDNLYADKILSELENSNQNSDISDNQCQTTHKSDTAAGYFSECYGIFNYTLKQSEFSIIHQLKQCTCVNGTAAIGENCPEDSIYHCVDCDIGFMLIDNKCNQCDCSQNSTSSDCFQFCQNCEFYGLDVDQREHYFRPGSNLVYSYDNKEEAWRLTATKSGGGQWIGWRSASFRNRRFRATFQAKFLASRRDTNNDGFKVNGQHHDQWLKQAIQQVGSWVSADIVGIVPSEGDADHILLIFDGAPVDVLIKNFRLSFCDL